MTMPEEYRFWIDAYSPESIPMARLAAYMHKLATLLGQEDRVHFARLEPGSTSVVHRIEREAVPKIRQRVALVATGDGPDDAKKAYRELNDMLRNDNAIGELRSTTDNILRSLGAKLRSRSELALLSSTPN